MRVSDYPGNAGNGGDFGGSALRVAAGNEDLAIGIFAMDAANGSPSVMIGRGRDSTGVEDYDVSTPGILRTREPAVLELPLNGGTIGLRGAAAEILNVKSGHESIIAIGFGAKLAW